MWRSGVIRVAKGISNLTFWGLQRLSFRKLKSNVIICDWQDGVIAHWSKSAVKQWADLLQGNALQFCVMIIEECGKNLLWDEVDGNPGLDPT